MLFMVRRKGFTSIPGLYEQQAKALMLNLLHILISLC